MLLLNCRPILNGTGLCGRTGVCMFHTKVDAIALLRFVNKEILQHVVAVCCGERLLAYPAMNREVPKFRLRSHANKLVA
jgi:hypothetical protein